MRLHGYELDERGRDEYVQRYDGFYLQPTREKSDDERDAHRASQVTLRD